MEHTEMTERFEELFNTKFLPSYKNPKRMILNDTNSLDGFIFTLSFNMECWNFFPTLTIERTMFNDGKFTKELKWTYEYSPYTLEKYPNVMYSKAGRAYHKNQGKDVEKWDSMLDDAKYLEGVITAFVEQMHLDFQIATFNNVWESVLKDLDFIG